MFYRPEAAIFAQEIKFSLENVAGNRTKRSETFEIMFTLWSSQGRIFLKCFKVDILDEIVKFDPLNFDVFVLQVGVLYGVLICNTLRLSV